MYHYHNSISHYGGHCDPFYPRWRHRHYYREPFWLDYDYGYPGWYGYRGGYGYNDRYY